MFKILLILLQHQFSLKKEILHSLAQTSLTFASAVKLNIANKFYKRKTLV